MIERIHEYDVWQRLGDEGKPVVIYGMGDGADKIMDVLCSRGIPVAAVIASDGFVRGHSFRGFPVERYRDVCARYDDFNVVLAFAVHDAPMLAYLKQMNLEHAVLAPDVPVAGGGLFTRAFVQEHDREFDESYSLLVDDVSRRNYMDVLQFKISGKIEYLLRSQTEKAVVYRDWLRLGKGERIVDLGAYDGDTVREFIQATEGEYGHILAVEPDAKNFQKLLRNTAGLERITCVNLGAWDRKGSVTFEKKAGRNSRVAPKGVNIPVDTVDHLAQGPVTLLKMDVEGSESVAIRGAAETIRRDRPKLYLCAYHRNEDMFRLPLQVHGLSAGYRFYFCHHPYLPAWESNFYGVVPSTL